MKSSSFCAHILKISINNNSNHSSCSTCHKSVENMQQIHIKILSVSRLVEHRTRLDGERENGRNEEKNAATGGGGDPPSFIGKTVFSAWLLLFSSVSFSYINQSATGQTMLGHFLWLPQRKWKWEFTVNRNSSIRKQQQLLLHLPLAVCPR